MKNATLLSLLTGAAFVSTLLTVSAWANEDAYQPRIVISEHEMHLDFKPDSTSSTEVFQCIRIVRPQDIEPHSKLSLPFTSGIFTVEILEAYTLTPDGKRIDVSPSHIQEHDANDSDTGFNDDKEISVVYPEVTVGSQVCERHRYRNITPILPGFASDEFFIPPQTRWEKIKLTVRAPSSYQVLGRGLQGGFVSEVDGIRHYRFKFEHLNARKERSGIDPMDFAPGLFVSSAKDYAEVARISWRDFKPAITPTDAIRRLAQDLTKGAETPTDKARILYHWVNRNIRYSAIRLGRGGWVPKSADAVLQDKHGDCKGMTVLLVSLLASVGIDSTPALISTEDVYKVPTVPVLYFDHAITYIPSLHLFLDATAKHTPFAVLNQKIQGKPALLLASAQIMHTPFDRSQDSKQETLTFLWVKENGDIKGGTSYRPTGRMEAISRSTQFRNKAKTPTRVIDDILYRFHETGTGSIQTPDPDDMGAEWLVNSSYLLDPVSNFPGPGAMRIPVGIASGALYQTSTFRHDPAPQDRPTPCMANTVVERTEIIFPKSVRITRLPPNVTVRDGLASYKAHYTLDAKSNRVVVSREYVQSPAGRLCSPNDEQSRQRIHKVLQRDMRQQVFYD